MIQYNDTHIAAIGGTPKECSDKIDTYNFVTEEFQENVATLLFNRTHHLCALIPEGKDGNPTVVICKQFLSLFCFKFLSNIFLSQYQWGMMVEISMTMVPSKLHGPWR